MRKGGGVGFIVVLVVAAIVMILAMRQWLAVAPTAEQIMQINQINKVNESLAKSQKAAGHTSGGAGARPRTGAGGVKGASGAGDADRRSVLPDLSDMKSATDEHAAEVKKASESTND